MRGMLFVCLLAAGGEAVAAEYLNEVESPVFELPGATPAVILEKAKACVGAMSTNDAVRDVLIEAGSDGSTLVSMNQIAYSEALLTRYLRSSMAVTAKDGRFRIMHTKIEFLNEGQYAIGPKWIPVGKWWGAGGKKAEAMLVGRNADLAACIQKPAAEPSKDW